jgi:hypothetical protein
MSSAISGQTAASEYYWALQIALAANGGTITIDYDNGKESATLDGASIRESPSVTTPIPSPADVVSFSADARTAHAASAAGKPVESAAELNAQIELTLLTSPTLTEAAQAQAAVAEAAPPAAAGVAAQQASSEPASLAAPATATATPETELA